MLPVGIARSAGVTGPSSGALTVMELKGTVQRRTVMGPGGEAAPSGNYLMLAKPVRVGRNMYTSIYVGDANVPVGRPVTLRGEVIEISQRRVTTTVNYALMRNATSV